MASKKNTPRPFVIDDESLSEGAFKDRVFLPLLDGEPKGHGLVPRQHSIYPPAMFAPPSEIKIVPRAEWSERIKEKDREGAALKAWRDEAGIPSLDQGSNGYCWGHSTAHVVMLVRMSNGSPYVPLSAYMVCAILKKGRNEGGWCGLSAKFLREVGICPQSMWPQGDRNYQRLDTPAVRAEAAKYRVTEDWVDLTREVYDQNLTFEMVASLALANQPCAVDYNWWGHSVCAMGLVEVEPGSFGLLILNSWSDRWGERGTAVLRGGKAIPDGAVCLRVAGAA